jgi:iron(III) transport system substrate-binding protein
MPVPGGVLSPVLTSDEAGERKGRKTREGPMIRAGKTKPQRRIHLVLAAAAILLLAADRNARAEDDWSKVVAAAEKEGKVIVWGQAGEDRRKFWKDAFERQHPRIAVRLFQAPSSSQRDSRYVQERRAGVFSGDLFVAGAASATARLLSEGLIRPIKPLLRPETLDPRKWLTGDVPWMDNKKERILVSDAVAYPVATVHRLVNLTSFEELLDPKYDGKILMPNPLKSGSGFAFAVFMYHEPNLGVEYMKKFFARKRIVYDQDDRQNAEWVDSGRALIGIDIRPVETEALQAVGGTLKILDDLTAKGERIGLIIGSDGVAFVPNIDPLPNPNAARVYLDWFYSKAGQQALVDTIKIGSNQAEVDQSKVSRWAKPRPGVRYLNLMIENYNTNEAVQQMRQIIADILENSK